MAKQNAEQLQAQRIEATSIVGRLESYDTNASWTAYKEKMEFFFEANGIDEAARKKAIFITSSKDDLYEIIRSLVSPKSLKETTYEEIIAKLDNHFAPTPNEIVQRFHFYKRLQKPGESIACFVKDLRKSSEHCNFAELEKMLRDQIVCGVLDSSLQRKLFGMADLTFQSAYEAAIAHEAASKNVAKVRNETVTTTADVLLVKELNKNKSKCYRCGYEHEVNNCKFKNARCNFCKKKGHIAKVCFKKKVSGKKKVHNISDIEVKNEEDYSNFSINHLIIDSEPSCMVTVKLNETAIEMEVDSGAACSIISNGTWQKIKTKDQKLKNSKVKLVTWAKQKLKILGEVEVMVQYKNTTAKLPVIVMQEKGKNLLGRNWFNPLKIYISGINVVDSLIKANNVQQLCKEYEATLTTNFSAHQGPPVSIELKESASPVFRKHRPVPFAIKKAVEVEIEKLVKQGILEPVEFSSWATPIVAVRKKDGDIRLCGDYRSTVNSKCKTNAYPLPTIQEVLNTVTGACLFSKIDLQQAYQQLVVDEATAEVLTINTHKGLFKVHRLPFGISAAPGIFQKFIDNLLIDIPGVIAYLDDIIVSGTNQAEHYGRLEEVLKRLKNACLTIKLNKCQFEKKSIQHLGFVISDKGVSPDKEKVEAIHQAPIPKNKEQLQSFLGMLTFYNRFLPERATIAEKLHRLLEKNMKWHWTNEHTKAFNKLKQMLNSEALLVHYDEDKEVIVSCDASPVGVGAVLAHKDKEGFERPIAYASRTLGKSERNYAQVDREALAIVFAVKHFHQFLAGRTFTIITDHRPLLGIFKKEKLIPDVTSPRMLRWCLFLSNYSYDIVYRIGKKNSNADCLSRLPCKQVVEGIIPQEILMLEAMSKPPIKAAEIKKETDQDKILSRVKRWTLHGWPRSKDVDSEFKPFVSKSDEISTHKGCLLWGNRVIIPTRLREQTLEILHKNHPGICQMKAIARSFFWWPKLDDQIEKLAHKCYQCQSNRPSPKAAPRIKMGRNENPWETVHLDFAGPVQGRILLVIVDAMSKWVDVKIVKQQSSEEVIRCLRNVFAIHGIPRVIVSDNGTAFVSQEIKEFYRLNGIVSSTTSPYHPSSNGQAERMVQYVKSSLKIMTEDNIEVKLARFLFKQHTMVHAETGKSPSELLMGRKLRTVFDQLHPDSLRGNNEPEIDKRTRSFQIGDAVFFRNYGRGDKWLAGTVIDFSGPLSYMIETKDENCVRRHIDQIRRREAVRLEQRYVPLPGVQQQDVSSTQQMLQHLPQQQLADNQLQQEQQQDISESSSAKTVAEEDTIVNANRSATSSANVHDNQEVPCIRRSSRIKQQPSHLSEYILY